MADVYGPNYVPKPHTHTHEVCFTHTQWFTNKLNVVCKYKTSLTN